MSLNYSDAKQDLLNLLRQAAEAHKTIWSREMEAGYQALDTKLPRDAGPEFDKLLIAFDFLGGWEDAKNHNWKYYQGIRAEDWPILAQSIISDLEAEREITEALIYRHFGFRK